MNINILITDIRTLNLFRFSNIQITGYRVNMTKLYLSYYFVCIINKTFPKILQLRRIFFFFITNTNIIKNYYYHYFIFVFVFTLNNFTKQNDYFLNLIIFKNYIFKFLHIYVPVYRVRFEKIRLYFYENYNINY